MKRWFTALIAVVIVLLSVILPTQAHAQPLGNAVQLQKVAASTGASPYDLQVALGLLQGQYRDEQIRTLLKPDRLADPFFARPSGILGDPGAVIARRTLPSGVASRSIGVHVDATQYKFVTRDSHGNPDVATATLLLPRGVSEVKRVLVHNDATDSTGLSCMPSAKIAAGRAFDVSWGIKQGYAVLVPDHDGLDAEYAATRQTGHIVLDAMRVVATQYPRADFIAVGYSGGALANYGAGMLQNEYAGNDLNGRVTAYFAGGTPVSLAQLPASMDGDFIGSGILLGAILGLSREYPGLYEHYKPIGLAVGYLLRNACLETFGLIGTLKLQLDWFAYPGAVYTAEAVKAFADTFLTDGQRFVPADLIIYHSIGDEWLPFEQAQAWHLDQTRFVAPGRARPAMLKGSGPHSNYGQKMEPVTQQMIMRDYALAR